MPPPLPSSTPLLADDHNPDINPNDSPSVPDPHPPDSNTNDEEGESDDDEDQLEPEEAEEDLDAATVQEFPALQAMAQYELRFDRGSQP